MNPHEKSNGIDHVRGVIATVSPSAGDLSPPSLGEVQIFASPRHDFVGIRQG
jgi:hypothetical protein